MIKLFDATCVLTALVTWREPGEVRCVPLYAGRSPIANRIVNLTLTTQSRAASGQTASAAWTLQSLSCTTNKGMRVRKIGTAVSRRATGPGKAVE